MEAVTILRELWRRRILVGVVALVSLLVGLSLAYTISVPPESRQYEIGIATGRILVDTPDSQVVDVSPKGSETLGARASLIANLMTEGKVKAAIAERAGLEPRQLKAGVEVNEELPPVLATAAGKPNAHLLITSPALNPDGLPLPIVNIEARAPDAAGAARLGSAAVSGLGDYLESKAAGEQVPDARRLEVSGLGAPQIREEARGPSPVIAVIVALLLFAAGCAAILGISSLARNWRAAAQADESTDEVEGAPARQPRMSRWRDRARVLAAATVERLRAGLTALRGRRAAVRERINGVDEPPADRPGTSPQRDGARELWIPGRDAARAEVNGRKLELVRPSGHSAETPRPQSANGHAPTSNGHAPEAEPPSNGQAGPNARRKPSRANGR